MFIIEERSMKVLLLLATVSITCIATGWYIYRYAFVPWHFDSTLALHQALFVSMGASLTLKIVLEIFMDVFKKKNG